MVQTEYILKTLLMLSILSRKVHRSYMDHLKISTFISHLTCHLSPKTKEVPPVYIPSPGGGWGYPPSPVGQH